MKKAIKNLSILCSVAILSMTAISCSSDDDSSSSSDDEGSTPSAELNGMITEDTTLDASVTYNLTGILSIEEGNKLTIPAGTIIETGTGTDVYMVVQKELK